MLTREDAIAAISELTGEESRKVRKIVLEFESWIAESMILGNPVRLHRFGSFKPTTPAARRVPAGFASTDGRPKRVAVFPSVKFKASTVLRKQIAERRPQPEEGL